MFLALYTLSGLYIMYRQPSIFRNLYRFSMLLGMFVLSVGLASMAKGDAWRAESIPIMLFRHDAGHRLSPGIGAAA